MRVFVFALLLCTAAAADTAQLKQVQTVYILPMGAGLDQYLANKIARQGPFQVVTDPQKADAILTDRIGEPFEKKLGDLYPPPPPPKPAVKKDDPVKKDDKASDQTPEPDDKTKASTDMGPPLDHSSSFARGRGTIFLVDRKSRAIIWSTYDRPANMRADTLDKTADQIIRRLKHDLNPKATAQ